VQTLLGAVNKLQTAIYHGFEIRMDLKTLESKTNPTETLSGKLKDGLKMYIPLRGARATGLCQIGKSSAPGIKQNAKAVRIALL
jgi:hypothetical protein